MHYQWLMLCCLAVLRTVICIACSKEPFDSQDDYLDCSYRNMTVFPGFESVVQYTKSINLRGNYIRTFPIFLTYSYGVEKLDMSYNELRQESVNFNKALKILDVSFNYIHSLNISSSNLMFINASNNFIVNVDLRECEKLVSLQLSNNKISKIENVYISYGQYLRYLDLSRNPIRNIADDAFGSFCNLDYLHLDSTYLSTLTDGLFKCHVSMRYLYLSGNNIEDISENIFRNLNNLEILDLQRNRLKHLPKHVFKNLVNLRILILDDNELVRISPIIFSRLHSLQHLSVRANRLTEVPPLHKCSGPLTTAVFNDNQITDISESVIRSLLRNGFVFGDVRNNLVSTDVCCSFKNASDIICSSEGISLSAKNHGKILFSE